MILLLTALHLQLRLQVFRLVQLVSVPYGAYDLKVYGDAVVNNYDDDVDTYSSTICSGSVSDPDTTAAALNKDIDDSSTHKLDMFDVTKASSLLVT